MTDLDWPPVEPISGENEPKPFPHEALPTWLGRYVRAEAESKQVPVDMTGMLALSVVSAGLQGRLTARVEDWKEPVTLYTSTVMDSGERKSSVFSAVTAPLRLLEDEITEREHGLIAANVSDERLLARQVDQLEKRIDKQNDLVIKIRAEGGFGNEQYIKESADLDTLRALHRERLEEQSRFIKLHRTMILSSDLTPEACAKILSEQRHSALAVMSSEGGVFDVLSGKRYSDAVNLDVFLKGHSGDEVKIHRINRDPEVIKRAILTLGLMVQPNVLESLASSKEVAGRGLLARFAYSMPTSLLGHRKVRPEGVSEAIREEYQQSILEIGRAAYDADEVVEARLSPDALEVFDGFTNYVEELFLKDHPDLGDLGSMRDWMGKFVGMILRISALFAAARGRGLPTVIEKEEMDAAVSMSDYLLDHMYRAYSLMGEVSDASIQKQMLMFFRKKRTDTFRIGELQQQWRVAKALKAERIEEVLTDLMTKHYVRRIAASEKPPRYFWKVNPAVTKSADEGLAPVLIEEKV